ncbi:MAG: hypothetical protein ACAI35_00260 [Candidatus Methylacidiphilales bacterium]|nr:hypothetical protein [Candidatus Methylacidiphilales bacterium]
MKLIRSLRHLAVFTFLIQVLLAAAIAQTPAGGTPAALPSEESLRVFYCGHSYHAPIPPILKEMVEAAGIKNYSPMGQSIIGGSKVIQHWNVKEEKNELNKLLTEGKIDVLTLCPIYLPDPGIENVAKLAAEHNPKIRILVQEFWLPFDEYQPHYYDAPKIPKPATVDHNTPTAEKLREIHKKYFDEMDSLVVGLNKSLPSQVLYVVPVGQAVIALREKIIAGQAPGLKSQQALFTDALGHPAPALQVLIAYCWFSAIFGKNPAGLPVPKKLAPMPEAAALNVLLQDIAWKTVSEHSLSVIKLK